MAKQYRDITKTRWYKFKRVLTYIPRKMRQFFNFLVGGLIGSFILPAQRLGDFEKAVILSKLRNSLKVNEYAKNNLTLNSRNVEYDSTKLDGIELTQTSLKSNTPHVIYLNGNYTLYKDMFNEMLETAQSTGANIIGFNYPNVGNSTGHVRSEADLVRSCIEYVESLHNNGVPYNMITLRGTSLGGAVATLTAKHYLDRGIVINVFNDRSLSNVSNFMVAMIMRSGDNQHSNIARHILGFLLKPLIKLIMLSTHWDMNAGDAFKALPKEHREYTHVRYSKQQRNENPETVEDAVMRPYGSLAYTLKGNRKKEKKALKKTLGQQAYKTHVDTHYNPRKLTAKNMAENKHSYPLNALKTRSTKYKTGQEFFCQFVKDTTEIAQKENSQPVQKV